MAVYLDASALVKLVVSEPESGALMRFLRKRPVRVSSALSRVEVPRAVAEHGQAAAVRARRVLAAVRLLQMDDPLLDAAAALGPAVLRSLDAIHIASALALEADLEALVTYDRRMARAAAALGIATAAPG